MSFTSFLLRTAFKRGDDKRDAGLGTPATIQRFDDLRYGADPKWNCWTSIAPRMPRASSR